MNERQAKAIDVALSQPSSSSVIVGTAVNFTSSLNFADGEVIPINGLELTLTGPESAVINFDAYGNE